eukprot:TRINITY_DN2053_c0_g1_i10.p1 TRINITY_DN2053_c0_g1~~TRINITY_DN2053_c0_g1_i10.p1  ORF type:complete len:1125 (-),score=238.02 TRINITY_DN2053_c0_g1_i10:207-3581(-)
MEASETIVDLKDLGGSDLTADSSLVQETSIRNVISRSNQDDQVEISAQILLQTEAAPATIKIDDSSESGDEQDMDLQHLTDVTSLLHENPTELRSSAQDKKRSWPMRELGQTNGQDFEDPYSLVDPETLSSSASAFQQPSFVSYIYRKLLQISGRPYSHQMLEQQDPNDPGGPHSSFPLKPEDLAPLHQDREIQRLVSLGGVGGIADGLKTDIRRGICTEDLEDRAHWFGRNQFPEPPCKTFWEFFKEGLDDATIRILLAAGIVSLLLEMSVASDAEERSKGWIEGFAILLAVFVVGMVTAWNNYSKELQFRALNAVKNNRIVKVIRHGEQKTVSIYDIVVGDLVTLETGDQIPADGLYLQGFDLEVDESVMTGESETVKKTNDHPFMLSGCLVAHGLGSMLVTSVGPNSEWGRTMSMLSTEQEETPLQEKLTVLAEQIGKIGLGFASVTFFVLLMRWIGHVASDFDWKDLSDLLDYFVISVTIVVVAVPEGLPLAVTISLAYSMRKMHKENNLVRHLAACETMGGATNICSDKTGTLTENRMTLVQLWCHGHHYDRVPRADQLDDRFVKLFNEAVSVNSSANIHETSPGLYGYIGNKTECALLLQATRWKANYKALRTGANIQQVYAFSSDRKRMSVLLSLEHGQKRLYTKGASEIVLELCNSYVMESGQVSDLSPDIKHSAQATIQEMAQQALRTICIAYRDISDPNISTSDAPEHDLTLIAIVGIQDPLRPEVPDAVEACKRAGIFVRMVTGDNITTAKAIAQSCGILSNGIAMEGPEFRNLSIEELDRILPRLQVLARSSPSDKYRLVKRLRERGEVVGVTGDGTNDAPALKEADIGLSMGLSGTEVAKEASDMIIMDDNFSTIVNAVSWGRSVFDNIRKFLQFQLTVNVVALVMAFIGGVAGKRPLTSVQLLWVNLLMDSWGALALGTERPTPDLLFRKPYGRKEALINSKMYRNIICQAFVQLVVLLSIFVSGCQWLYEGDECQCGGDRSRVFIDECEANGTPASDDSGLSSSQYTLIFNTFVFMQIFNEINCRRIGDEGDVFRNITKNGVFLAVIAASMFIQILIVEFGGDITQTVPLGARDWLLSVLLGAFMLVSGQQPQFSCSSVRSKLSDVHYQ